MLLVLQKAAETRLCADTSCKAEQLEYNALRQESKAIFSVQEQECMLLPRIGMYCEILGEDVLSSWLGKNSTKRKIYVSYADAECKRSRQKSGVV